MNLAVRKIMIIVQKFKEKFQSKCKGPFAVEMIYSNGAYCLINLNIDRMMIPTNGKFIKNILLKRTLALQCQ